MPVTGEEIDLMRSCMKTAVREIPLMTEYFHEELFRIAPETRQFYRTDLEKQGAQLINRLAMILSQMHDTDALLPFVEDLARRHVGYGVRSEHYPFVGAALLAAFRRLLGSAFTTEMEAAWTNAYKSLSAIMIDVAYDEEE